MKKVTISTILGLFVFLVLISSVQPALAMPGRIWVGSAAAVAPVQIIKNIAKFEGLLKAYDANGKQETEEKVLSALDDLSNSLDEFNCALIEIYPYLTREQRLAVGEASIEFVEYLQDLADRTNSILGNQVIEVEVITISDPETETVGRVWVGSFSST